MRTINTLTARMPAHFSRSLLCAQRSLGTVTNQNEFQTAILGAVVPIVPHRQLFAGLLQARSDSIYIFYGLAVKGNTPCREWSGCNAPALRHAVDVWQKSAMPACYQLSSERLPEYLIAEEIPSAERPSQLLSCGAAATSTQRIPFAVFAGKTFSIEHAHAAELIMPSLALALCRLQGMSAKRDGAALGLSAREREILHQLVNGKSNADIGVVLGIQVHTVKFHLKRLYEKLDVFSRQQAIVKAYASNLVELSEMRRPRPTNGYGVRR